MRRVILMAALAAHTLWGQGVMVLNGSSQMKGGKVVSTTLWSILEKPQPTEDFSGIAILDPEYGPPFETPCQVQILPGDKGKAQEAVWRVAIPKAGPFKALRILQGDQVVGNLSTPAKLAPPVLEFFEVPTANGVSLGWVLKRPEKYKNGALWARWSRDGGTTWLGSGKLVPGDSPTGELELTREEVGETAGLLVEFWVPQDLNLTKFQHKLEN